MAWSQGKEGGQPPQAGKGRDAFSPGNARRNPVLLTPSFTVLEDF